MKNIFRYAFMLGMSALLFASCKEEYDMSSVFEPDSVYHSPYVFVPGAEQSEIIMSYRADDNEDGFVFNSEFDSSLVLPPVQLTKPASGDVKVTLELAPDLVEAINASADDGKEYTYLNSAELETVHLTIPKGEYVSDSVRLHFDHRELFNDGSYALAARISSYSGDVNLSENLNSFVYKYSMSYDTNIIRWSSTSASLTGQLINPDGSPRNPQEEYDLTNYITATYAMSADTKIKLRINNDLIASSSYPSYEPCEEAVLKEETVTIAKGQSRSSATSPITIKFSKGMTTLKARSYYLIPIEIESVEGFGTAINTSGYNVIWFRLTTSEYVPTYVSMSNTDYGYTLNFDGETSEPQNAVSSLDTGVKLQSQKNMANSNATITLKINNSLIDSYNSQNSSDCIAAPNVSLAATEYTIGRYSLQSTENIKLEFSDAMAALENGKTYLIPVEIDTVSGNNDEAEKALENTVLYVKITTQTKALSQLTQVDAITGKTEIDRSAWSAHSVAPGGSEIDRTVAVKGEGSSMIVLGSALDTYIQIDMGDTHEVAGFSTYYVGGNFGVKVYEVQISSDNQSWESLGETDDLTAVAEHHVLFATPKSCRYVRLINKKLIGQGWYMNGSAGKGVKLYE